MTSTKKLSPADAQALSRAVILNGNKYNYLLAEPTEKPTKATIFLCHGWPDSSFGWRNQIPFLTDLGLRVVVPDMMGYAGTDAPKSPPHDLSLYGYKRAADDLAALAKVLDVPKIILGGHDWGGMIAYRFAQWYPDLVTHLFSVCTPFSPTRSTFIPTEHLVKGPMPQFGYQLQLAGPDVENAVQTKDDIRQFLSTIYGARTSDGELPFDPRVGVRLDLIGEGKVGRSPLLAEDELEFLVDQYARTGMHGPLNWYRNREVNFKEELQLTKRTLTIPVLFIFANQDDVLTRDLGVGMSKSCLSLTQREVTANHWALLQAPEAVNGHIEEWLQTVVFASKSTL